MATARVWGTVAVVAFIVAAALSRFEVPDWSASEPVVPAFGADWMAAVASRSAEGFERLAGSWELELPRDHGVHPDASSELWQMAAHLVGEDGAAVGVQFSLIRIGLLPPDAPAPASAWEARELYRGHVIVVDGISDNAFAEERFSRGVVGLAGYDATQRELRLDDWSLAFATDREYWQLRVGAGSQRLVLDLVPEKAPVRAAMVAAPFRGYAFSRLRVEGRLETAGTVQAVSGVAWFDHLWGDLPLPGGSPVGSDRLQLQLDDGSELSLLRSRRLDGGGTPAVDALLIGADGVVEAMDTGVAQVELTRRWQGAAAAWPVDWSVRLGDLELVVTPVMDNQEHAFAVPVWSGLVRAEGRRGDRPVRGLGTLQLTGYGN